MSSTRILFNSRLEATAIGLEATLEATAIGLEAIACRLEALKIERCSNVVRFLTLAKTCPQLDPSASTI